MKPSNPKYTPEQVGLTNIELLYCTILETFFTTKQDHREHYLFYLLNPEE